MKYLFRSDFFHFSWDQIAIAFWARYPNPYSLHVVSEDTIDQRIQNGKLYVKRLVTKAKAGPKWTRAYVPLPVEYVIEETCVDPSKKTIITYSRNIGHTKYVTVDEKCTFQPVTGDNNSVQCDRHVWVSARNTIGSAIQQYVFRTMRNSLANTLAGWNWTLSRLFDFKNPVEEKPVHRMQIIADKFHDTALREKERLRNKAEQAKEIARQSLAASSG